MLTTERLQEIESLLNGISSGTWKQGLYPSGKNEDGILKHHGKECIFLDGYKLTASENTERLLLQFNNNFPCYNDSDFVVASPQIIRDLLSERKELTARHSDWDKAIANLLPHLERCEFDDECDFCKDPQLGMYCSLNHIPEDVTETEYYKCGKCALQEYKDAYEKYHDGYWDSEGKKLDMQTKIDSLTAEVERLKAENVRLEKVLEKVESENDERRLLADHNYEITKGLL